MSFLSFLGDPTVLLYITTSATMFLFAIVMVLVIKADLTEQRVERLERGAKMLPVTVRAKRGVSEGPR